MLLRALTGVSLGLVLTVQGFAANEKIVGGEEVSPEQDDERQFSTVALTTDHRKEEGTPSTIEAGRSFCSGTIVSERVVVTAAHCLQAFDPATRQKKPELILPKVENFIVHFDTKVTVGGNWIRAAAVIPHPDWSPADTLSPVPTGAPNDIGIIILSEDIPEGAMPAKIADPMMDLGEFSEAWLAGFGVTLSRNNNDTGTLRQVKTDLKSSDERTQRFGVGAIGRGACAGDSGGPAFVETEDGYLLIGATSTGIEIFGVCLGIANNYTDVRYYIEWIESSFDL